jgi:peptidoglycan/LPS O-acetylase OafA/YrhL
MFFGGTEAVMVFFVLSGYVLVNSVSKDQFSNYARNRLFRLYAPIFVSVTLAAGLVLFFPRKPISGGSWWLNSHAVKPTLASYFKNLWVLVGNDWLNSILWTMRYEIIFSLAVIVFAKITFRKSAFIFTIVLVLVSGLTWLGMRYSLDLLGWMPVFFAGSALHWLPEDRFKAPTLRAVLGIVILFSPWCFAGFGYLISPILVRILMTIGAVIIVDVCRGIENPVSKVLSKKLPRLAGKYSYSLYLTHAPVLTTVWFVMGNPIGHVAWLARFLVALVCIGAGTTLVYQFGEKPSLAWIHAKKTNN